MLYVFIRGLILKYVSEICWILKFSASSTNLLLNSNEVSSILVQKTAVLIKEEKLYRDIFERTTIIFLFIFNNFLYFFIEAVI